MREVRTTYLPVENYSFVKSKLYIYVVCEVGTIYFVKSELYKCEKREVKTIYFVKSGLYVIRDVVLSAYIGVKES